MGGNERLLAQREVENFREKVARRDRLSWRALWLVTVAVFVLWWYLSVQPWNAAPNGPARPGQSLYGSYSSKGAMATPMGLSTCRMSNVSTWAFSTSCSLR